MSDDPPGDPWTMNDPFPARLVAGTMATAWLCLACGIRINMKTGEVSIPEGLTLDDAARAFWDAVRDMGRAS